MRYRIQEFFSVFGSFEEYVEEQTNPTDRLFSDWEKKIQQEVCPDGKKRPFLIYRKQNKTVGVHYNRIDIVFGFSNPYQNDSEFMEYALEILKKFADFEPGICGDRIALNTAEFMPDQEGTHRKNLSKAFNVSDSFGNADELSMRINTVTDMLGERFNVIINFQNGEITNNQTKEKRISIMVNTDINTLASNKRMRFNFEDLSDFMMQMVSISTDRVSTLQALAGFKAETVS